MHTHQSWLHRPAVAAALEALYADAQVKDPQARQAAMAGGPPSRGAGELAMFSAMRGAYMAINREFGRALYALARGSRARTIVEFGTSFGVSTIWLAAALRDNGGGRLVTTEFEASKVEQARRNLASVGLDDLIEFRVGDALATLPQPAVEGIDLVFLDGAKGMYLDVLRLLEPGLRSGALVASDNTDHDGMEPFLAYLRDPANGYVSTGVLTPGGRGPRGHEISVRT